MEDNKNFDAQNEEQDTQEKDIYQGRHSDIEKIIDNLELKSQFESESKRY